MAGVTNSQDEACGADVDKRRALSASVDASKSTENSRSSIFWESALCGLVMPIWMPQ